MKYVITSLFICLLAINVVFSQEKTFNKYIESGIALHDAGKYQRAINQYEKALKINKKSTLAHAEIAYSYTGMNNVKMALKHVNRAFKGDNPDNFPMIYILKGNVLDNMGKTKQAVKIYQKGIAKHPEMSILYFNLGITQMRAGATTKAKNAFITAISKNYSHASSHYYLGKLMEKEGEKVPAMLAYYFFLLLEPETIRADEIYDRLLELVSINNDGDTGKKEPTTIDLSWKEGEELDLSFMTVELMLSSMNALNSTLEGNEEKTTTNVLIEQTKSIFNLLEELSEDGNKQGIWWDFYTAYFTHLSECEVITAFCHHIGLSKGGDIALWIEAHEEETIDFVNCVNEYGR